MPNSASSLRIIGRVGKSVRGDQQRIGAPGFPRCLDHAPRMRDDRVERRLRDADIFMGPAGADAEPRNRQHLEPAAFQEMALMRVELFMIRRCDGEPLCCEGIERG